MAVTKWTAAGKHTWRRGHFFWGKKVVVGHRLLERVAVVVTVCVDWQHVGGLVAAEAGGGCRRGGLAEGERGAWAAQGEGGPAR